MASSTIPAVSPPAGITSNFINPPTLMSAVIAGTVVIHLFTAPFIIARAVVNFRVTKAIHAEDFLCYVAYACCIAYTAVIVRAEVVGMARHMWDIPLETLPSILRLCNTVFLCYTAAGGLAKTVVFLQLKKIFTTGYRDLVYWVIVSSLVANAAFYTTMFFLYLFTCWPREKIWNPAVPGRCIDSNKLNMAMGTLNVISDVEAFMVPAWALMQLNMKLKRKLGIFAIFSAGAIAVAIGIVGLYYRIILLQQSDFSWLLTQAGLICMAELAIVIIVGCCPYIPRFVRQLNPQLCAEEEKPRDPIQLQPPRPIFNTFRKYLATNSGLSRFETTVSEEHLEPHHYQKAGTEKTITQNNEVIGMPAYAVHGIEANTQATVGTKEVHRSAS